MKSAMSKFIWFDGKIMPAQNAKVSVTTHAIHYGTSVFEGIRSYWNGKNLNIFRLDDHIKRFRESGEFYEISPKYTNQQIINAIINLCKKNNLKQSSYIRPFYFVGEYGISLHVTSKAPTHLAIFTFPFGDLFDKNGIKVGVSSWRKFTDESIPPLAKMGGNYLNSILATQESKRNGYDEALLLNQNGNPSEAPGENIFIIKDQRIITPPLSASVLEGITRDTVNKIAIDLGYNIESREITRSEMYLADEIFLTGTAAEITPVITMDHKKIGNGKVGSITRTLVSEYTSIVMGKNEKYKHWLEAVYK